MMHRIQKIIIIIALSLIPPLEASTWNRISNYFKPTQQDSKELIDIFESKPKTSIEDYQNEEYHTSTFDSIEFNKKIKEMIPLLQNGANVDSKIDNFTLFEHAVTKGKFKLAKFLFLWGANINRMVPGDNVTFLMHCIQQHNFGAIKFLINNGANINQTTKHGTTALMIACRMPQKSLFDLFSIPNVPRIEEYSDQASPEEMLSGRITHDPYKKYLKQIEDQKLLQKKHNAEIQTNIFINKINATAIAENDNFACLIVPELIEHGANINAIDDSQMTALDYANENRFVKTAAYLRSKGAKTYSEETANTLSWDGLMTVLHPSFSEFLIEK